MKPHRTIVLPANTLSCPLLTSFFCEKEQSQIRGGWGGLRIIHRSFFLFLHENMSYDSSLEPFQQDGSNEGSQHTVKPAHVVTSIKGSPALSSHICWVL